MQGHDAAFGAFVAFAPPPAAANGALAGLRVAVKDNIAVAGLPHTAGVPRFAQRIAGADAAAVARLRAAGASIVGVTRTDAGGLGVLTPDVENPRHPESTVGGSSGGSAAAVAANYADVALGTDTGGSVRIPAACCDLFGFKPTHGRVPADGVWPLAPMLEDVGLLATSLQQLVSAWSVLGECEPARARGLPVIGVDRDQLTRCEAPVVESFERSLARLVAAGCTLRHVALPDRDAACEAHARIVLQEALRIYAAPFREGDEAGLGSTVWRALQAAEFLAPGMILKAHEQRLALSAAWPSLLAEVDFVALPTLPVPVPRHGSKRVSFKGEALPATIVLTAETSLANFLGTPALAIPVAGEHSLQLVGRAGDDAALLAHAATIDRILAGGVHG